MSDQYMAPSADNEQYETQEPPFDLAAVGEEAKADFTLADMLTGNNNILPTKKSLVVRDLEAGTRFAERSQALDQLKAIFDMGALPEDADEETRQRFADMEEQISEREAAVEEARAEMLKTALSFHLRAYPNVALKIARREARKLFIDPATGKYLEGYDQTDVSEWIDLRLFGETVQKVLRITDDGPAEVQFGVPKAELGELLSTQLHPVAWAGLFDDYQQLTLRARLADAATRDPGF